MEKEKKTQRSGRPRRKSLIVYVGRVGHSDPCNFYYVDEKEPTIVKQTHPTSSSSSGAHSPSPSFGSDETH